MDSIAQQRRSGMSIAWQPADMSPCSLWSCHCTTPHCFKHAKVHRNLRFLEAAGAELVPFSPIEDSFPARLAGVYLGGGYPERHAHALSANKGMRAALLAFALAGGVVYGECGGLLYLTQSLQPLSDLPSAMGKLPMSGCILDANMLRGPGTPIVLLQCAIRSAWEMHPMTSHAYLNGSRGLQAGCS